MRHYATLPAEPIPLTAEKPAAPLKEAEPATWAGMMSTRSARAGAHGKATDFKPRDLTPDNVNRLERKNQSMQITNVLTPRGRGHESMTPGKLPQRRVARNQSALFSPNVTTLFAAGMGVDAIHQAGAIEPKLASSR